MTEFGHRRYIVQEIQRAGSVYRALDIYDTSTAESQVSLFVFPMTPADLLGLRGVLGESRIVPDPIVLSEDEFDTFVTAPRGRWATAA